MIKNARKIKYIFVITVFTLLLAVIPVLNTGCQADMEQFEGVLPSSEFSVLMVPDVNLDVYIYAKQNALTTVPGDLLNMSHDIQVESLAIWGVPENDDMVIGIGLTFDNETTASEVYGLVPDDIDVWKFLRGNNLYVVKGLGPAAESIISAIENNKFKQYDNSKLIEAANMLPKSVRAKLISIALAKPSTPLINFIGKNISQVNLDQINEILRGANLETFIAALYSPNGINIAKAVQVAKGNGSLEDLNMGLIVAVKSGFPGIIVEPRVENILVQQGLEETKIGELTVYKGNWQNPYVSAIPVCVRVEGSDIFISVSGQESYAETLITSIYK